jgi:exonuclease III
VDPGFFACLSTFYLLMLNLLTINVNGLLDLAKRSALLLWLGNLSPSPAVICLQETHCVSDVELQQWFSSTKYSCRGSFRSNKSAGVGILCDPSLQISNSWADADGCFLMLELSFSSQVFRVACLYAPTDVPRRHSFFLDIVPFFDPLIPSILAGDFNSVFDRALDRRGGSGLPSHRDCSVQLSSLFVQLSLFDVWRHLHPNNRSFSWCKPDGSLASRIDFFGFPEAWKHLVQSSEIVPCPYSDHEAVSLSTEIPGVVPTGPGVWKFNVSLLLKEDYLVLVRNFWAYWVTRKVAFRTPLLWWDLGKSRLKLLSINYSTHLNKKRRAARVYLDSRAATLKIQLDAGHVTVLPEYKKIRNELATLDAHQVQALRVRSRVRWAEEGESSSSYFLCTIRKTTADKLITSVQLEDKSYVSSTTDLLTAWQFFYKQLFTAADTDDLIQEGMLENLESTLPREALGQVCT